MTIFFKAIFALIFSAVLFVTALLLGLVFICWGIVIVAISKG